MKKQIKLYSRTDAATYARLLIICEQMAFTKDNEDESGIFYMFCHSLEYSAMHIAFVKRTIGKRVSYLVGGFVSYRDGGIYQMARADEVERELTRRQKALRAEFQALATS